MSPRRPGQRLDAAIRELPPASFAFVMATGILSTGCDLVGWDVAGEVLFALATIAFVVLVGATLWRALVHREAMVRDLRSPARMFGFFTLVAAANVIGLHDDMGGRTTTGLVLTICAGAVWLVLTYALPAELLLRERPGPLLDEANGTWFLWPVATQSLATGIALVGPTCQGLPTALVAVGLWGVGVMHYLLIATLLTLRLLTRPIRPATLSPTYWTFMGATAIAVLAAAKILSAPASAVTGLAHGVVAGVSFVLWALGLWWIPLLVIFGVWRHVLRRIPLRYDTALWGIVFPLGMLAAASIVFGRTQGLTVMELLGEVMVGVGALAWLGASGLMLASLVRWTRA